MQFYAEVAEANSWMDEKRPLLENEEFGKDEDTVQVRREYLMTSVVQLLILCNITLCQVTGYHPQVSVFANS